MAYNYEQDLERRMQNLKNRMDSIDRKNNAEYQKRREEAAVKEIVFDEQPPQTAEISDDEDVKLVKEWITWHCFKKKKKLKMRSCLKLLKNKYNINAERPDKSK